MQLKSAAKPSTVIELITSMQTVSLHLDYSQCACNAVLFFEYDKKIIHKPDLFIICSMADAFFFDLF